MQLGFKATGCSEMCSCRWIEDNLQGNALMPRNAAQRTIVSKALDCSGSFESAGMDLVSAKGGRHWGIGTNATVAQRQRFEKQCSQLSQLLQQSGGPYFGGREVTLADIVFWPFMERFELCAKLFSDYDIADSCGDDIARWMEAMQSRPAVQCAAPEREAHAAVLQRERCLDWFDFKPCQPHELHPHLKAQ